MVGVCVRLQLCSLRSILKVYAGAVRQWIAINVAQIASLEESGVILKTIKSISLWPIYMWICYMNIIGGLRTCCECIAMVARLNAVWVCGRKEHVALLCVVWQKQGADACYYWHDINKVHCPACSFISEVSCKMQHRSIAVGVWQNWHPKIVWSKYFLILYCSFDIMKDLFIFDDTKLYKINLCNFGRIRLA